MNKKRKIGTLLILIGIGIPLLSFFFQDSIGDVVFVETKRELKYKEAVLDPKNPDDAKLIENAKILGKIDKPTSMMIGLDKEEITYTTDKRTGLIIMRWDYYYDYKGGFEIPYKYILALGIILALIGAGMVIFSYSQIEIKKAWKENKGLIIPWLLFNIIAVFLLLIIKQHVKVNNILHVVTLITLVFFTWKYARQTQNLVKQERASFKDRVKKRNVDFEEKKLKEFYNPFKYLILDLKDKVKNETNPLIPTYELSKKITTLGASNGHLITEELETKAVDLLNSLFELSRINVEDEEQLNLWRTKVLEKIKRVMEQRKKEVDVIDSIIKEFYVLFSEKFKEVLSRAEESEG